MRDFRFFRLLTVKYESAQVIAPPVRAVLVSCRGCVAAPGVSGLCGSVSVRQVVAVQIGTKIRKAPVILTRKMASAGWWVSYSVLGMGKARLVDRALVGVFGCYAARWLDTVSIG